MGVTDYTMAINAPKKSFRSRILHWLGITDELVVKVYHGYGHADSLVLYGHVLRQSPLPRRRYRKSILNNAFALLRLFMVRPFPHAKLATEWQGKKLVTEADEHGFFKFEWKDEPPLEQGWHTMVVRVMGMGKLGIRKLGIGNSGNGNSESADTVIATGEGSLYIPYATQYGFISDVDDTFLVSHSSNMRKRLFVLFTQNARSRQPFEGVVKHYQLLATSHTNQEAPNPFFYVSSSEWNLYDYLLEFTRVNELPKGIFLLNVLKLFKQLLKTGQNNHQTKFTRIARILEAFPKQRFVLLGDSSQHDPYIYEAVVKHFPKQIHAVYIRDVYRKNKEKASDVLGNIESAGVPCCFFSHSSDAIMHSKKIGLIQEEKAVKGAVAADNLESVNRES